MDINAYNDGKKAFLEFSKNGEELTINFKLDSMRTMRFIEAAVRSEKIKSKAKKTESYITVMGRAIDMIGDDAFEELEGFYDELDEELTTQDFIGAIMEAFSNTEELPKG